MIVQGDNLQFLKTCFLDQDPLIRGKAKGKVKLVCMDPPFATKATSRRRRRDSYVDRIDRAEFVEQLRERLIYIREILDNIGCIYVHLDERMAHYIRVVMDEVSEERTSRMPSHGSALSPTTCPQRRSFGARIPFSSIRKALTLFSTSSTVSMAKNN